MPPHMPSVWDVVWPQLKLQSGAVIREMYLWLSLDTKYVGAELWVTKINTLPFRCPGNPHIEYKHPFNPGDYSLYSIKDV